ncbi:8169_t:CDS:2 [Diversispora eburnea]|uniref:8169_t:CDS:1 n=1 Tax=Diversispora eburnea TaxID=1213867 RepID=A0A9N8ZXL6_9GLOM|nr:8169_t:CDS:2 [Diversispora eburnea]
MDAKGKEPLLLRDEDKLTKLTLLNLRPEQVIVIFDNNFNELRRFSFDNRNKIFDDNKILCKMAENVPESLETIEMIMGIISLIV